MKMLRMIAIVMAVLMAAPHCRADEPLQVSPTRKGVETSTDVVAATLPLAAATYVLATEDWQGFKQQALSSVTAVGTSVILKFAIHKQRPDHSNYHSMPSLHTSATFVTAAFLQRRYGWKVGVPAYVLSTYVGWGRIFAKKHDIWDVVAGAAIGIGSAYIYTRPFAEKHQLSIAPVTDGRNIGFTAQLAF